MILVESSNGLGHFNVVEQLVKALSGEDCKTALLSGTLSRAGGVFEFDGAELFHLPTIVSNDRRGVEVCLPSGQRLPCDERALESRRAAVLGACRRFQPTLILFELYPFFMPFRDPDLSAVEEYRRSQAVAPKLVCLSRDIVFSPHPVRTVERLNSAFDHVLVRGESSDNHLSDCMKEFAAIEVPTEYMGRVASQIPPRTAMADADRHVVVSVGGGHRPGDDDFIRAAMLARRLSRHAGSAPWHVFLSQDCPDADFERHEATAEAQGGAIRVRRPVATREFKQMIVDSLAAVVRGGYNTTIELCQARVPFVVVPREKLGFNCEQSMRADALQRSGHAGRLSELELGAADGPFALARALDREIETPREAGSPFAVGGAQRIAARLMEIGRPAGDNDARWFFAPAGQSSLDAG